MGAIWVRERPSAPVARTDVVYRPVAEGVAVGGKGRGDARKTRPGVYRISFGKESRGLGDLRDLHQFGMSGYGAQKEEAKEANNGLQRLGLSLRGKAEGLDAAIRSVGEGRVVPAGLPRRCAPRNDKKGTGVRKDIRLRNPRKDRKAKSPRKDKLVALGLLLCRVVFTFGFVALF